MVITSSTRNRVDGKTSRGFESHHLRHSPWKSIVSKGFSFFSFLISSLLLVDKCSFCILLDCKHLCRTCAYMNAMVPKWCPAPQKAAQKNITVYVARLPKDQPIWLGVTQRCDAAATANYGAAHKAQRRNSRFIGGRYPSKPPCGMYPIQRASDPGAR